MCNFMFLKCVDHLLTLVYIRMPRTHISIDTSIYKNRFTSIRIERVKKLVCTISYNNENWLLIGRPLWMLTFFTLTTRMCWAIWYDRPITSFSASADIKGDEKMGNNDNDMELAKPYFPQTQVSMSRQNTCSWLKVYFHS